MQNAKIYENVFLNIRILVQYRRKTTKKVLNNIKIA